MAQSAGTRSAAGLRRAAMLSLISIPVAAEVVVGEALFVGHIVLLVETLGFGWGMAAFAVIWAVLGVAVLAAADSVWPRVGPWLRQGLSRATRRVSETVKGIPLKAVLAVLAALVLLAGVLVTATSAGDRLGQWMFDHRGDAGLFALVAAFVSAVLMVMARLGRGLESWVRRIADTAGPVMRSLAALLSMVILGPVFAWLLFRLLRFSRRSVYTLTVVAAPIFAAVWVPVYGLGVWELLQALL